MKKLFSVILCAVLLLGLLPLDALAVTEYELYVAGVKVTSSNKADVLGDGAFSFDPDTNTLTVKGDCDTGTAETNAIKNYISGLTVYVAKDVNFNIGNDNMVGIFLGESLKITGPGLLKVNSSIKGRNTTQVLTIEDAMIETTGVTYLGGVRINKSFIRAGSFTYCGDIYLGDCTITEPAGAIIDHGFILGSDHYHTANNVTIEKAYDFLVGGKYATIRNKNDILNNGVFSYNPDTNVLTVRGNYSCSKSIIENYNDGLTVYVEKDSVLKCTSHATVIDAYESLIKITGPGKLTLKGHKGITVTSYSNHPGTVMIDNAVVEINGTRHGIKSAYGSDPGYLVVRNSYLRCTSDESSKTTGAISYIQVNIDGGTIVKPENTKPVNSVGGMISGIMNKDGTYASEAVINTFYDLYISGSQVTALSALNIGGGKFMYDAGINVLYVNGTFSASGTYPAIENRIPNLTIYALDTATLSSSSTALLVKADTMITGPGLLSLTGTSCGIFVRDGARLTVVNAGMMVGGGDGIMGISPSDGASLTVNSSHMIITSTDNAAVFNLASITLNDDVITSPSGAYIRGGDIVQSNGSYAKTVTISTPMTKVETVNIAITKPAAGDTVTYNSVTLNAEGYGIEYGYNNSTWSMGVIWKENNTTLDVNEAHTFVSGNKYTVTVSVVITDTDRYKFAAVNELKAYINGKEAEVVRYSDTNYGIRYTFDLTPPQAVTDIYVTIPEPEAGNLIYYYAKVPEDCGYRVQTEYNNGIRWESGVAWDHGNVPLCPQDDDYFTAGDIYRVHVTIVLTDDERYEFGNLMDMYILVNDHYADYEKINDSKYEVWYDFTVEAEPIDEILIYNNYTPAVGQKAGESENSMIYDSRFSIAETDWYCDTDHRYMNSGDVFEAGKMYSHRWKFEAAAGYVFDEDYVYAAINDETDLVDAPYCGFGDSVSEYVVWTVSAEPVNMISEVRINGYTAPAVGQTVSENLASINVPSNAGYRILYIRWIDVSTGKVMNSGDTFGSEVYIIYFNVVPEEGFSFGGQIPTVYINGSTALVNMVGIFDYEEEIYGQTKEIIPGSAPDIKYGDVNGDGEITGKDLIRLRKYLNGEDVEISAGADVNGDGTVTGKDLIRLRKYLNGESVVLGPG